MSAAAVRYRDRAVVAVIGGGLAGLSCACRLADEGHRVVLLEARARLGGATFSFDRDGLTVDNGQHVLLRCYESYLGFLARIGADQYITMQPSFDIPVRHRDGRAGRLARTPGLPAPLHLGPALARYTPLSVADRLRVLPAAAALRFVDPDDPESDRQSFGDWLARHGQNAVTVAAVWDLITVAALNTTAEQASLALAAKVFRTALLQRADAADIGMPSVELSRLHAEPAARYLADRGADIRLHTPVRAVRQQESGFTVRTDSDEISVDGAVIAVPPAAAERLCPPDAAPAGCRFSDLGAAPIVNVHVVYPHRVLPAPFCAFIGSDVQWAFDRTGVSGVDTGQYLAVSVSAAQRWIDVPTPRMRETFTTELGRLLPAAARAEVRQFFVTRERAATFRQVPGCDRLRPGARTALPGLALAGAWTATGWPDTMEAAVRSGDAAAGVVAADLARAGAVSAA